jgi:RNA polymerase sigma factor (TIGR02999 family)
MTDASNVTGLLQELSQGHRDALDRLIPIVYDELRKIAHGKLRDERSGHTLNTTALVHEAYLKLVDVQQVEWQDRTHFYATAAQLMRRILIDYARARQRDKRGGKTSVVDPGLRVAGAAPRRGGHHRERRVSTRGAALPARVGPPASDRRVSRHAG